MSNEETIENINNYIKSLDDMYFQERSIMKNPKGYHPDDARECRIIWNTIERVKKDLESLINK